MTKSDLLHRIAYWERELHQAQAESQKPEHRGEPGLGVLLWELDARRELAHLYDELAAAGACGMTTHSYYECAFPCGVTHRIEKDGSAFVCSCGRPSILDAGLGYTEQELIAMLNELDRQRDRVVHAIEFRRDRRTAA